MRRSIPLGGSLTPRLHKSRTCARRTLLAPVPARRSIHTRAHQPERTRHALFGADREAFGRRGSWGDNAAAFKRCDVCQSFLATASCIAGKRGEALAPVSLPAPCTRHCAGSKSLGRSARRPQRDVCAPCI